MELNYFNKSESPKGNLQTLSGKKPANKNLLTFIQNNFLISNDNLNSIYRNQINYRFYYKNPQFLNRSSIQNQIDILLTNINNKEHILSKSLKKIPKIKTLNNSLNIKSRKQSFDSLISKYENNNQGIDNDEKNSDYIYKNIFPNSQLFKQKTKLIDNKLNIIYSQNELQYKRLLEKRKKIKKMGNIFKLEKDSEKIKAQVDDIKTKIKFMKNIMDYSYPSFMLTKIKTWEKKIASENKSNKDEILTPIEEQKKLMKRKNIIRSNYLKQNVNISPLKFGFYSQS